MEPRSILVVDDDAPLRNFVTLALEKKGYRVASAVDGRRAGEAMKRAQFDVVITDLLMPDCDGLELITQVRRGYPAMRIIAMSGGGRIAREQYLRLAKGMGAHVLLAKPFMPVELFAAVDSVLAGMAPQDGPGPA
jgi:DNA-binding response OmpR family regulator